MAASKPTDQRPQPHRAGGVFIYARFSPRPNPGRCDSIADQLRACRACCASRGWSVAGEYTDAGVSGTLASRPGLDAALDAVLAARGTLLVYSLSRLARSVEHALSVLRTLQKADCGLLSVSEQLDTTTAFGKAIFALTAVFSELERDLIAERTRDALTGRQQAGIRVTRRDRVPFGYAPDPESPRLLIPEPSEQQIITQICSWHALGLTPAQISLRLRAAGTPHRSTRFHSKHVRRILKRATGRQNEIPNPPPTSDPSLAPAPARVDGAQL